MRKAILKILLAYLHIRLQKEESLSKLQTCVVLLATYLLKADKKEDEEFIKTKKFVLREAVKAKACGEGIYRALSVTTWFQFKFVIEFYMDFCRDTMLLFSKKNLLKYPLLNEVVS